MSQVSQTFNVPWPGSGPGVVFPRPSNLVSQLIQVIAIGGNTTQGDINGPFPASLRYGAQVTGSFDPALCPLTLVIGSPGQIAMNGAPFVFGAGGDGFSGGGGAGGSDFPQVNTGICGGGGSTGILTSASGSPAVLIEAAGSDGGSFLNPFVPGGLTVYGGSGGGGASNTPNPSTPPGVGPVERQSGSGGASGGTGGPGYDGGVVQGPGGLGFGIVGSGANGNPGTVAGPGAGVGSGGIGDPNGICGKSFADTTNVQFVGVADATTTAQVTFTYRTADQPLAPTNVSPALGQFVDGLNEALVFSGVYNAPSADTGALERVVLQITHGVTVQYWDGSALVSSPALLVPTSGFGAVNGGTFTVAMPAGVLSDNVTYDYAFATVESLVGLQGPFSAQTSFNSVQFPSVVITSPTEGQFVNSLVPTVSWNDTIPSGSQIGMRLVVYETAFAPTTSPPTTADASAVYDVSVATSSTSRAIPLQAVGSTLPLISISDYTVFVMITSTGNAPSPWARVDFTIELQQLATPTLSAIPTTHPPTGMPAPQLIMEARDNLLLAVASDMEGIFSPPFLSNATVAPSTSGPLQGSFSTAVTSTAGGTMTIGLGINEASQGDTFYGQCLVKSLGTNRVATLIANWLNSGGASISMSNLASATESGVTHLAGGSPGAPAGTVAIELLISWASTSASEVHLVDAAGLNLGTASTVWFEGVGQPAIVVTDAASVSEFQADYVGDGSWVDVVTDEVPVSMDITELGTTSVTYDIGAPFNIPLAYRVRNFITKAPYTTGGFNYPAQVVASPWSNTFELLSGLASSAWWIVPPTNPDGCMALHRLPASSSTSSNTSLSTPTLPAMPNGMVASFVSDEQEQMGVFRPFGKDTAIVVHGDIWDPEFDLNLYFEDTEEWDAFRAIRDLQQVVLVKSDMEGSIYWVSLGPDLNPGIIKQGDRQTTPTRGLTIHCVPTDPFVPG